MNELIRARRSVRQFFARPIPEDLLEEILLAGMQAPSGKNGQPWKFLLVQKDKTLLRKIAALTLYEPFVKKADALVAVFLDKTQSYHYLKDAQAAGACIQNMLLQAQEFGIGSCWIGEILNRDGFVKQLLGLDHRLDLMAVIAFGYPDRVQEPRARKKSLSECLIDKK